MPQLLDATDTDQDLPRRTGAARLMADLVAGNPPLVDPAPFCFARLAA